MLLRSQAFGPNERIPDKYGCLGCSPPLSWSGLPEETSALSLLVEDPDATEGGLAHWLLWNIRVDRACLGEGVKHQGWFADDMHQGDNDFGEAGWSAPRSAEGESHRYVFHLYALDAPLPLRDGATRAELEAAMAGHVLDEATLVGIYPG